MKLLTLNFLTCARKTCKSQPAAFPLHPREAELEQIETDLNPLLIRNLLGRLDWEALKVLAGEVSCHVRFARSRRGREGVRLTHIIARAAKPSSRNPR